MLFNYFDEEVKKFYYKDGKLMVSYHFLRSSLIKMKKQNIKESKFSYEKNSEQFILRIIKDLNDNEFEFQVNESPKLYIKGRKNIFFQDKIGNTFYQTHAYNKDQLLKYQNFLMRKNPNKNVEFFDEYETLITDTNSDDFFNKVHCLKIKAEKKLEEKQEEEFYQNLFNRYIDNNFSNEGEKLSFNLPDYSGQKNDEFLYINSDSRNQLYFLLDDFIQSNESYLAITGISGTGKTITLLKFLSRISKNYPNCYFNIKKLLKVSNIKKLSSEFVKLFNEKDLYKNFIELVHKIENNNNLLLWDKIIEILDFIIQINIIKEKIIIVIDQYKLGYDPDLQLMKMIELEKYKSRIKFIICSSINEKDIKSNLIYSSIFKKLQLKSLLLYKYIDALFSVEKIIKNEKIKNMMKEFNYIPKYYYLFINDYHKDDEDIKDIEKLEAQIRKFFSDQFNILKDKLESFFF